MPSPSFPVADGIWPDGTPSVSHTYDQVDYHPGTNSFVMMKTQHDNTGGKSSPVVAMFSLDGLKPPDSNANRDWNKRNWRLSPRQLRELHALGRLVRVRLEARPVLGERRLRHPQLRELRPEAARPKATATAVSRTIRSARP